MVKALEVNAYIKKLDLSCNDITDEGAKWLGKLKQILELDLSLNLIKLDGAIALFSG